MLDLPERIWWIYAHLESVLYTPEIVQQSSYYLQGNKITDSGLYHHRNLARSGSVAGAHETLFFQLPRLSILANGMVKGPANL